jgi:hypothetical protein
MALVGIPLGETSAICMGAKKARNTNDMASMRKSLLGVWGKPSSLAQYSDESDILPHPRRRERIAGNVPPPSWRLNAGWKPALHLKLGQHHPAPEL